MWLVVSKKFVGIIILVILGILTGGYILIHHTILVNNIITPRGYIALVIDDFGNHGDGTEAMINLAIPVTVAVMPFLPYSQNDADIAHKAGMEVIMHISMEPEYGKKNWLSPMSITSVLNEQEVKERLKAGLKQLRWAVGMNNHMGSKVMKNPEIVKVVLEMAKKQNLFFIDSLTTEKTAVPQISKLLNYPCLTRDEFLDGCQRINHIKKQLQKLADIALKKGYAIGIGHVGPEGGTITAQAIKESISDLEKKGICFVFASQIKEVISYFNEGYPSTPVRSDKQNR